VFSAIKKKLEVFLKLFTSVVIASY